MSDTRAEFEQSEQAGTPVSKTRMIGCALATIVVLGICGGVLSVLLGDECGSYSDDDPRGPDDGRWVVAHETARDAIAKVLRAPKTAKWSPLSERKAQVRWLGERDPEMEDFYEVTTYVDSQNMFGATVRSRFRVVVTDEEMCRWDVWTLEPLD